MNDKDIINRLTEQNKTEQNRKLNQTDLHNIHCFYRHPILHLICLGFIKSLKNTY